jgi:alpha-galactosidase
MDRRHFIQISSGSFAALIFTRPGVDRTQLINPPDEVLVQSANAWFKLKVSGLGLWLYQDLQVELEQKSDCTAVFVESPSLALQGVRLIWKQQNPPRSTCLGDHWERTYGDLSWQPISFQRKAPWYLLVNSGSQTSCFGLRTGCRSIGYWQVDQDSLQLTLDTRSGGEGVHLKQRRLHGADIVVTDSQEGESPFLAARRFCKMMCLKPILSAQPVYGINDWYFAYGNNSKELILQHTSMLTDLATSTSNRPFSVIDAGWAKKSPLAQNDCCWGDDFSQSNDKFGDMFTLAKSIKELGMKPGLWVRPLCAKFSDPKTLLMPVIKNRDDPKAPLLDPTIEENLQRIGALFRLYRQWGYDMAKHDYTSFDIFGRWGFEMTEELTQTNWHFNDVSQTNAEIILRLYQTIREGAAGLQLIGCNTVGHLSAGIFELNRIGDDTSGREWQRTRKMGVNTLGFRIVQHNCFYATDADCVGITNQVPWEKNKQWMQLLAQSSTPLFVSADPSAIGEQQRAAIKKSFGQAALSQPVGEPLDWLTNPLPSKWKLDQQIVEFEW